MSTTLVESLTKYLEVQGIRPSIDPGLVLCSPEYYETHYAGKSAVEYRAGKEAGYCVILAGKVLVPGYESEYQNALSVGLNYIGLVPLKDIVLSAKFDVKLEPELKRPDNYEQWNRLDLVNLAAKRGLVSKEVGFGMTPEELCKRLKESDRITHLGSKKRVDLDEEEPDEEDEDDDDEAEEEDDYDSMAINDLAALAIKRGLIDRKSKVKIDRGDIIDLLETHDEIEGDEFDCDSPAEVRQAVVDNKICTWTVAKSLTDGQALFVLSRFNKPPKRLTKAGITRLMESFKAANNILTGNAKGKGKSLASEEDDWEDE